MAYTFPVTISFRSRPLEWAFLALLVFSVLWRGGKSIDTTWIATLLMAVIFLFGWISDRYDPAARAQRLQEGICPSWVRVLALGAIIFTILSYITSQTRNYGLDEVLRTVTYILTFLWIIRLREQGKIEWLEWTLPPALSLTAILASMIGVVVYLLQPVTRFAGTFFDYRFHTDYWPNAWAELLLIALPMTLVCILRSSEKKVRWMAGGVLLLSALYLSYSRGGMLAFGGECLLLLLIAAIQIRKSVPLKRQLRTNAVKIGTVIIVALFCVGILSVSLNAIRSTRYEVESIGDKVTFSASEGTSSVNERAQFWEQAIEMIRTEPWTGWGPYSFRFVQPAHMTSVLATSDHPHNAFLKIAAERGLPAALFFSLLIIGIFFSAVRRIFSSEATSSLLLTGSLLAVTGVLLHVMIDYNLQFVGIGLAFFTLLGFLAPVTASSDARRASFLRWKTRRRLSDCCALIALLLFITATREGWFLVTSSFGRHSLAAGDAATAQEWFDASRGELFSRDLLLSSAQLHLQQSQTGAALAVLDDYQKLNALDARAWRLRGETLLVSNNITEATEALERAYELGRYIDIGTLRLLLQSYNAGQSEAYKARKEEFDLLFRAYADAILQNTHFIALSQNVEELQKVSRLLSIAFPNDAQRYASIAREALNHAKDERSQYAEKEPGLLW
jgi:O-antigen ligase